MNADSEFQKIAGRVANGKSVRKSPRELLELFGAQRRGVHIVAEFRSLLARHKLKTEPDFQDAQVDEKVLFQLTDDVAPHTHRFEEAERRIQDNGSPVQVSVRELLRMFGASRRGQHICDSVDANLAAYGLRTDPNYRSAYIEDLVELVAVQRKDEAEPALSDALEPASQVESSEKASSAIERTSFLVGTLAEANRDVVSVSPEAPLSKAVSVMATERVSHLPVIRGDRDVKGLLRWKHVGRYLQFSRGTLDDPVKLAMGPARIVQTQEPFLRVIPDILEHGCVIVRDEKRLIRGIITKKDLGRRLQDLSGPFVTLGEIERSLRVLIERGDFTGTELGNLAVDPSHPRDVKTVADLTLGECQRLMERSPAWDRIGIPCDKATFTKKLGAVRSVRNDVMHFDPDSPTQEDRKTLSQFLEFTYELCRYLDRD